MRRAVDGKWLAVLVGVVTAGCSNGSPTPSDPGLSADREQDERSFTIAVIGDTPYGDVKLAEFPSLVALINADPAVERVLHAGDIKAGKNSDCSSAYFHVIRGLFDTFDDPLVYTPGDNEWTDCHVEIKNNGLYTPTERLVAVRDTFFPVPGQTLGIHKQSVQSQASDPANAAYVENVMWTRSDVLFAALNITGSNNDLAPWGSTLPADAGNYPSQTTEQTTRAAANAAWLERVFGRAHEEHSPAVVLLFQADMWDPAEPTLTGYDALVNQIGTLAANFKRPVLLLEGDSHVFQVDNPYSAASPYHAFHPSTPLADNVTRIVVEGSDKGRTEYLRLTIDPKAKGPFSWVRVPLN